MRNFRLPRPPRTNPRWFVVSIVVHLSALALLVWVSTHSRTYEVTHLVRLVEDVPDQRQFTMRLSDPVGDSGVAVGPLDALEGVGPRQLAPALIGPIGQGIRGWVLAPPSLSIGIPGASATIPGAIVVGTRRRIGPALGDGRLWTEIEIGPFPSIEDEWGPMQTELAMRVVEMLDSVMADSMAIMTGGLPRWVFTAPDGGEWGIDSQFIRLGPIKIPTMLLGLLPIPNAGNYELAQQQKWLADVRNQIIRQAATMEHREVFQRNVDSLRARMERERNAQRRRTVVAERDTVSNR